MGTFRMRSGEHVVRDTDFARHVRKQLRDPNLFTGYNVRSKRWFLGLWLRKDEGEESTENSRVSNIREMVKAGHPRKQAQAAAYRQQRKAKGSRKKSSRKR